MNMYFSDYHLHKNISIRSSLLWEYDLNQVDFETMKNLIIQRVIERGRKDDFYAIINMYGLEEVRNTIKKLPYLTKKDAAFVRVVFNIKKEELACYSRPQSKHQHWTS